MRIFCLVTACVLGFVHASWSAVVERLSVEDLARGADAIVVARVVATSAAWNEARTKIYTFTTLDVSDALKGDPARRVVVKELGGAVGDIALEASGTPRFSVGEEVLVFWRSDSEGAYRTGGLAQGKMRLLREPDTGRTYAQADVSGLVWAETAGGRELRPANQPSPQTNARRVYLDELKERIRASAR